MPNKSYWVLIIIELFLNFDVRHVFIQWVVKTSMPLLARFKYWHLFKWRNFIKTMFVENKYNNILETLSTETAESYMIYYLQLNIHKQRDIFAMSTQDDWVSLFGQHFQVKCAHWTTHIQRYRNCSLSRKSILTHFLFSSILFQRDLKIVLWCSNISRKKNSCLFFSFAG